MIVQVRLFARAQQLAESDRLDVELPDDATVSQLRDALGQQCPGLAPIVPQLFVAVEREYASDDTLIRPDVEIACFPPVSGG